jgi:hypothetical protein
LIIARPARGALRGAVLGLEQLAKAPRRSVHIARQPSIQRAARRGRGSRRAGACASRAGAAPGARSSTRMLRHRASDIANGRASVTRAPRRARGAAGSRRGSARLQGAMRWGWWRPIFTLLDECYPAPSAGRGARPRCLRLLRWRAPPRAPVLSMRASHAGSMRRASASASSSLAAEAESRVAPAAREREMGPWTRCPAHRDGRAREPAWPRARVRPARPTNQQARARRNALARPRERLSVGRSSSSAALSARRQPSASPASA